ncbi:MAG: transposase [Ramlibacter sp.]
MARLARLTLPGSLHHVIQRGNNREPIFKADEDRRLLLELLESNARALGVAIHSYVLMDNHFHLLATPKDGTGLPKLMQAIGRRYVRYFNQRHGRTGTLWEGRYRSTLIQAERYGLACMVYIDLNPVRAGIVSAAADFPWSSHRSYAGYGADRLVTPHPRFWALGNTPFAREQCYMDLVGAGLPLQTCDLLTNATLKGWAVGDSVFLAQLHDLAPRRPVPATRGRPRKIRLVISP